MDTSDSAPSEMVPSGCRHCRRDWYCHLLPGLTLVGDGGEKAFELRLILGFEIADRIELLRLRFAVRHEVDIDAELVAQRDGYTTVQIPEASCVSGTL